MSIEVMSWAWKTNLKSTLKLTLLALADYSNDDGLCWPSIDAMVKKSSLTRSSLIANVQKLCCLGIIEKKKRYENGRRSSNQYRLKIELSPESIRIDSGRPKSIRMESIRMENQSVSPESGHTTIYKPSLTNNRTVNNMRAQEHKHKKKCAVKNKYSKEFEQFYKDYPRHRNKPRAYKAWLKINPDETLRKKIMGGVDTFKKYIAIKNVEEKYIPYPEKWLNGTQWEDDYDLTKDNKSTTQQKKSLSEQYADNLRGAWKEATA